MVGHVHKEGQVATLTKLDTCVGPESQGRLLQNCHWPPPSRGCSTCARQHDQCYLAEGRCRSLRAYFPCCCFHTAGPSPTPRNRRQECASCHMGRRIDAPTRCLLAASARAGYTCCCPCHEAACAQRRLGWASAHASDQPSPPPARISLPSATWPTWPASGRWWTEDLAGCIVNGRGVTIGMSLLKHGVQACSSHCPLVQTCMFMCEAHAKHEWPMPVT